MKKFAIILLLTLPFAFAVEEVESRIAVVTAETLFIYSDPPKVQMKMMQAHYIPQEKIYTLVKGDTITVFDYVEGLKKEIWAFIEYHREVGREEWEDEDGNYHVYIDTVWNVEGWILEQWKDVKFIRYLDDQEEKHNSIFNLHFLLFGQSADIMMQIQDEPVDFKWWALAIIGITLVEAVVVFRLLGIQNPKHKFYTFVMFWILTMCSFGIAKFSEIAILLKGKIG